MWMIDWTLLASWNVASIARSIYIDIEVLGTNRIAILNSHRGITGTRTYLLLSFSTWITSCNKARFAFPIRIQFLEEQTTSTLALLVGMSSLIFTNFTEVNSTTFMATMNFTKRANFFIDRNLIRIRYNKKPHTVGKNSSIRLIFKRLNFSERIIFWIEGI